MATYRVAVIGHTGRGDYGHGVDTVWASVPRTEVVAVSDADEKGRASAVARLKVADRPEPRAFVEYREMLDAVKPDIVAIGPRWIDQHCDMVLAAAERGMHVYMEKPFCRTLEEADRMIEACERKHVKLAIAHQTRYSPKIQVIRDLIAEGQLGTLLEIRGRGKEDRRGGAEDLWVLGSHVMNLIHVFAGEPQWCFASLHEAGSPVGKQHVKPGNEGLGPLAGDTVTAMFGMENGVTAYFGSHRDQAANPSRFGIQMFGSKGVIELLTGHLPAAFFLPDGAWSPGRSGKSWLPITSAGVGQPETMKDGGLGAGNALAVQDLLAAIEKDRDPECSMYEARATIEMISGIFESHRQGRPVTFPLTTRANPLSLL